MSTLYHLQLLLLLAWCPFSQKFSLSLGFPSLHWHSVCSKSILNKQQDLCIHLYNTYYSTTGGNENTHAPCASCVLTAVVEEGAPSQQQQQPPVIFYIHASIGRFETWSLQVSDRPTYKAHNVQTTYAAVVSPLVVLPCLVVHPI